MYFYFNVKTHVDKINAKQKIIKTLVCTVKKQNQRLHRLCVTFIIVYTL